MNYFNDSIPTRSKKLGAPKCKEEGLYIQNKDYKFRNASLLDIPFIFDLIQDGSQRWAFTEKFLTPKGWVEVLSMLILDVLAPHRYIEHGGYDIKLLIFTLNDEDVGFMKIKPRLTDRYIYEIDICAVAQEHRNQNIGSQMIRMFIEDLPSGTEIVAYCTKYSRAMQHIFKMQKFIRDKKTTKLYAECFHFSKPSSMA